MAEVVKVPCHYCLEPCTAGDVCDRCEAHLEAQRKKAERKAAAKVIRFPRAA